MAIVEQFVIQTLGGRASLLISDIAKHAIVHWKLPTYLL